MKLYTTDNSELMEITVIEAEGRNLVVTGTIMGAVPVKAVLKPEDLRAALGQMSLGTMFKAATMLVRGTSIFAFILLALIAIYGLTRIL
jgi:hypothetical protein